jgi:hypothetical protein
MKQSFLIAAIAFATFAVGCSSSPTVGSDEGPSMSDGDDDDGVDVSGDGGVGVGPKPPGMNGADAGNDIIGGGDDELPDCEPLDKDDCEDMGLECGRISDGCGDTINCGSCGENEECGLFEHNVCAKLLEICEPLRKSDACEDKECGPVGNGCGGSIDCGDCDDGERCGLYEAFQCGVVPVDDPEQCTALIETCEDADVECGTAGNGCGGTLDCGSCEDGEICGIREPGQCDPPPECEPMSPEEACEGHCGVVANGCDESVDGGLIDCSDYEDYTCPAGTICGGAGVANECGNAASTCLPMDQMAACDGLACGVVSDGCNSSFSCGDCSEDSQCINGVCEPLCVPLTANEACEGKECGMASDGCGDAAENLYDCAELSGGCADEEYCGLLEAFQCDAIEEPECEPTTCVELGWECGIAIDECGNTIDCTAEGLTCNALETCIGGIDAPAQCQTATEAGGSGDACDVCDSIPAGCTAPTTVTGRVVTPGRAAGNTGNQVGVPNAFVYILRNNDETELPPIASGIPDGGEACDRCDEQDLGPVLVGATTDATGAYELSGNIPVGEEFVLVVKVGKFRRAQKYTLDGAAACATTALPETLPDNPTRLPRDTSDGLAVNIPQIAVSTGQIDAMECVLEKMGIAPSEFGNFGSAARVHLYRGGDGTNPGGARIDDNTPHDAELYGDLARLENYDMVVADCEGPGYDDHNNFDADVRSYLNRGGRMFASHLSYTWIYDNDDLAYDPTTAADTGLEPAATWVAAANLDTSTAQGTGVVSIVGPRPNVSPRIDSFAEWLVSEGVTTAPGYSFTIIEPRSPALTVGPASEEFVYCDGGGCPSVRPQQFSFNTPYAAPDDAICGRVAYSGFHVAAAGGGATAFIDAIFPAHCTGDLTNQEKVLLYMLFDLGACVGDEPEPPVCEPVDCGERCGTVSDGCSGVLDCECPDGETCIAGQCGVPPCTPSTCAAQGATCGFRADGCGGVLDCGECLCTPNQACPEAIECGLYSDGCGGALDCGECPPPQACINGQCGIPDCPALECSDVGAECGWIGDGCGDTVDCGPCPAGQYCRNNRCRGCSPQTCEDVNAECGQIGDGCGDAIDCGPCPEPEVCGIERANRCGPPGECEPTTCEELDAECGMAGDGCGDAIDCGPCPEGQVCGLEEPFKCGTPPPCEPVMCEDVGAECGEIGNGCGGVTDCGPCPAGYTCSLIKANQCDKVGIAE